MLHTPVHHRTFRQNGRLAGSLAGVAGFVNVVGLMEFGVLTTNVTGHFAFAMEVGMLGDGSSALRLLAYVFVFFLGAFFSGFWLHSSESGRRTARIPVLIEAGLLFLSAFGFGQWAPFVLLFSMGLQNALVTHLSQSVVRTTHLTGILTDLGIDVAQIASRPKNRPKLESTWIKLIVLASFALGSVVGGTLYHSYGLLTNVVPAALLLALGWRSIPVRAA